MQQNKLLRIALVLIGVAGLVATFLFQRINAAHTIYPDISRNGAFIVNRTIRFLLNDIFALSLLYGLFPYRSYFRFAIAVQLCGVFLILLPYFVLKFYFPGYNGPMINFIHRLIINPTLLLLLIPAFYYQRIVSTNRDK